MSADHAAAPFEELRQRIAVARAHPGAANGRRPARPADPLPTTIARAAELARIGEALPPLGHLSLPRRVFALVTGRVALYFLRLITLDQSRFNELVVRGLTDLQRDDRRQRRARRRLRDDTQALRDELSGLRLALEQRDRRLDALRDALAAREGRLDSLAAALAGGQVRLEELRDALAARDRRVDSLSGLTSAITDLRAGAAAMRTQLEILQRRAVAAPTTGATETDPAIPAAVAPPAAPPPLAAAGLGPLLCAEQLRDSEERIGVRQEPYVRHFLGRHNVLDVGCGRGEFLERLRAAGVSARGVDSDLDMVLRCREKGLAASDADALAYLAALPDASLGGLFCAQVVEHLRTPVLVELIRQAARTLEPGAPLVIETLNPESLLVLYRWFWMDLTHERLVHPETLMLLLRAQGFASVACEHVPPPPGPLLLPTLSFPTDPPPELEQFNAATQYLNQLLYGSFDYAVVASR